MSSNIPIPIPQQGSLDIQNDEIQKNINKKNNNINITEKNIQKNDNDTLEKEKNNTKEKRNEKNIEKEQGKKNKNKGKESSSPYKELLQITTPHDQNNKRKYTETPITPSAPPIYSQAQQQVIFAFSKDKSNVICPNCTNTGAVSITHIVPTSDLIEFTCTICKQKLNNNVIVPMLPSYQANKKHAAPEVTILTAPPRTRSSSSSIPPLAGTNEHLVSEVDKLTSNEYNSTRSSLICPSCSQVGTINKNGHDKAHIPKPIFKCRCGKTFSIDQIRDIINSYNMTKPLPQINIEDDNESVEFLDSMDYNQDELKSIPDSKTTPDEPCTEPSDATITSSILVQLKALQSQVNSHQEQFIYYNSIIEENKKLQKENLLQKKEIEYLKKKLLENEQIAEKNITKEQNTTKNNSKEKNTKNNTTEKDNNQKNNNMNTLTNPSDPSSSSSIYQSKHAPANTLTNQPSYAAITATKPKKTHFRTKIYRNNQTTDKSIELASRVFNSTTTTTPPNYVFVHFPCKTRMKPSDIRKKLTLLGIDNVRILDAHCPDWNVVALLVHENYVADLNTKFQLAKVGEIVYDYFDPVHLRDPRHNDKTTQEKILLLQDIRKKYLKRIISRIRYPVNHSVAKSLFRNQCITLEELKNWIKEYRLAQTTTSDGFATNLQQEENENNMAIDQQPQQITDLQSQSQIDTPNLASSSQ